MNVHRAGAFWDLAIVAGCERFVLLCFQQLVPVMQKVTCSRVIVLGGRRGCTVAGWCRTAAGLSFLVQAVGAGQLGSAGQPAAGAGQLGGAGQPAAGGTGQGRRLLSRDLY